MMKNKFLYFTLSYIFFMSQNVYGRELEGAMRNLADTLRDFFGIVAIVALLASGILFFFNKRWGSEQLQNAIIGTIICSASSGIFSLITSLF